EMMLGKQKGITVGVAVLIIAIVAAGMGGGLYLVFHYYKEPEGGAFVDPEVEIEEEHSIEFWGSAMTAYKQGYVDGLVTISPSREQLAIVNGQASVEMNLEYVGGENAPETVVIQMTGETEIYTSWKSLENGKFPENARVDVNEILSMEPETIELKKGENIRIVLKISILENLPREKLKRVGHRSVPVPLCNYRPNSDRVMIETDKFLRLTL
ncbi:hypothetical protein AKJ38_00920, partial [candidate division MSBL1 archaeon SCGC-AAA259I14]